MENVEDPLAPKDGQVPLLNVYNNGESLIPEIPPPYKNWEEQEEDNTEILKTRKQQLEEWIVKISSRSDELKQHKEKLLNGRGSQQNPKEKDIYNKSLLIVIKGIYKEDVMMGGIYKKNPELANKKIYNGILGDIVFNDKIMEFLTGKIRTIDRILDSVNSNNLEKEFLNEIFVELEQKIRKNERFLIGIKINYLKVVEKAIQSQKPPHPWDKDILKFLETLINTYTNKSKISKDKISVIKKKYNKIIKPEDSIKQPPPLEKGKGEGDLINVLKNYQSEVSEEEVEAELKKLEAELKVGKVDADAAVDAAVDDDSGLIHTLSMSFEEEFQNQLTQTSPGGTDIYEKYKPLLEKNYYTNYLISHLHKKYINGDIIDDKKCKLIIYLMFRYEGRTIKSWKEGTTSLYEILTYYLKNGYKNTFEEYRHILNGIEEFAREYIDKPIKSIKPIKSRQAVSQEEETEKKIDLNDYISEAYNARAEAESEIGLYKNWLDMNSELPEGENVINEIKEYINEQTSIQTIANGWVERLKQGTNESLMDQQKENIVEEMKEINQKKEEINKKKENIIENIKKISQKKGIEGQQDEGQEGPPNIEAGGVWNIQENVDKEKPNGENRCWINAPLYTILQNETIRRIIQNLYDNKTVNLTIEQRDCLKGLHGFIDGEWSEGTYLEFIKKLMEIQKKGGLPELIVGTNSGTVLRGGYYDAGRSINFLKELLKIYGIHIYEIMTFPNGETPDGGICKKFDRDNNALTRDYWKNCVKVDGDTKLLGLVQSYNVRRRQPDGSVVLRDAGHFRSFIPISKEEEFNNKEFNHNYTWKNVDALNEYKPTDLPPEKGSDAYSFYIFLDLEKTKELSGGGKRRVRTNKKRKGRRVNRTEKKNKRSRKKGNRRSRNERTPRERVQRDEKTPKKRTLKKRR